MRLRWKFFLVLLIFSLLPLAAVTTVIHQGTIRVGEAISKEVEQNLTRIANGVLKLTAENSARILENVKLEVEFALRLMVYEAESALAKGPPAPPRVYYAHEFDNPSTAPPDIGPQPGYMTRSADGRLVSNMVSFGHPSYFLAPGATSTSVADDLARLSLLTPVFIDFKERLGGSLHWVHWLYVSTETGLHVSFPGHGGYPDGYDPRKRVWYTQAGDEAGWTQPMVDATTGQVIMTVSQRIRRPDGSAAGVAAIDVLIAEILRIEPLSALWTTQMQSLLVVAADHPGTGETRLLVAAKKDYEAGAPSWESGIEMETLGSGDSVAMTQMVDELARGRAGYLQMPYRGVASIWAYAPVLRGTHFLIIVPKAVVDQLPEKTVGMVRKYTQEELLITALAAAAAVVLATLAALAGSRSFTRPILELVSAARRLSRGDFSVRVSEKTGDERDRVIEAFNDMVPKLEDRMRLHESLQLATEVQQNLLPRKDPVVPGLDISGISIYCDETGGDYYDFLELSKDPDGSLDVVVADVSGHGVHAALLMASARAALRLRASLPGPLSERVADVNRLFTADVGDTGSFMTLFCLSIDVPRRTVRWVRAGHDPALLYDPGAGVFEELSGAGGPLGVDENLGFADCQKSGLRPGQILFVGTDGIWETTDPEGRMFGKPALYRMIRTLSDQPAAAITHSIIRALETHRRGLKPADDITMVVIKFA
jgi:sigma-B regulation protein RsbU (phosphoserine phosphatase)